MSYDGCPVKMGASSYRDQVGRLIETLNVPQHRAEAAEVIRSLIERVVLTPDESENRLVTDLHGDLAGLLAVAAERDGTAEVDPAAIARHKHALGLESVSELFRLQALRTALHWAEVRLYAT